MDINITVILSLLAIAFAVAGIIKSYKVKKRSEILNRELEEHHQRILQMRRAVDEFNCFIIRQDFFTKCYSGMKDKKKGFGFEIAVPMDFLSEDDFEI